MTKKIAVVMATYNGSQYLNEQLESLVNQSLKPDILYIRDDRSTDQTEAIIHKFMNSSPFEVIYNRNEDQKGVLENFSLLLQDSSEDYIFFCDQDDVWTQDKIKTSIQKMKEAEESSIDKTPILVYHRTTVVDENLNTIAHDLVELEDSKHLKGDQKVSLFVQNYIPGCTILINKALHNLVTPIPKEAIIHDWYIIIAALFFGEIIYSERDGILYRQHSQNTIGIKRKSFLSKVLSFFKKDLTFHYFDKILTQAHALQKQHHNEDLKNIIECFQNRSLSNYFYLMKRNVTPQAFSRKLLFSVRYFIR